MSQELLHFEEIVNQEEFLHELAIARAKKTYAPWDRRDVTVAFELHAKRRTGMAYMVYNGYVQQVSATMYEPSHPDIPYPEWFATIVDAEYYEEGIIRGSFPVGSIISYGDDEWLVTHCDTMVVIPDEEDERYDQYIGGNHSWIVKVLPGDPSLRVVAEQVQAGQAIFTSSTTIKFQDEPWAIPLYDLGYNQEIGLYQRSRFPHLITFGSDEGHTTP